MFTVFVVIGKELFLREVLEWFKLYKKYKDAVHVFGVVLIPETGAPCPDFVWSTRATKKENGFLEEFSDVAVEKVLEVSTFTCSIIYYSALMSHD